MSTDRLKLKMQDMDKMDYEKLPLKLWNYAPGHHRDGPLRILH